MPRWYYLPCICTTRARRRGPPSYPPARTRGLRNRPSLSCSTSCPPRTAATEATENNVIQTQHRAYHIHPPWRHARTFLVAISLGCIHFPQNGGFVTALSRGCAAQHQRTLEPRIGASFPVGIFFLRAAWLCRPCDRAWLLRPQFLPPCFVLPVAEQSRVGFGFKLSLGGRLHEVDGWPGPCIFTREVLPYHLATISGNSSHDCRGVDYTLCCGVSCPRCARADDDGMGSPDHASSLRTTTCTGCRPRPDAASSSDAARRSPKFEEEELDIPSLAVGMAATSGPREAVDLWWTLEPLVMESRRAKCDAAPCRSGTPPIKHARLAQW